MIYGLYGAKERREEVIARNSSTLVFYSRSPMSRFPTWEGPITIAGGVTGTPAIIQSSNHDFHLVTPLISGGLGHYWRSISDPVTQWNGPEHFGTGTISGISMIESDYGNLELVARAGDKLVFYQRSDATWKGPYDIQSTQTGIVDSVTGDPTLIQATFGGLNHKDFELVVPRAKTYQCVGLCHYWRNNDGPAMENDDPTAPWIGPAPIADTDKLRFRSISTIQSNYGPNGYLVVIAQVQNGASSSPSTKGLPTGLITTRRENAEPWTWSKPKVIYSQRPLIL